MAQTEIDGHVYVNPGWGFFFMFVAAFSSSECGDCSHSLIAHDYLVAQTDAAGKPMNCLVLRQVHTPKPNAGQFVWQDGVSRNVVTISGPHVVIQVTDNSWEAARVQLGVPEISCRAPLDATIPTPAK